MEKTNCDSHIDKVETKVKYRVSIRYKAFIIEECILSRRQKDAVVHFLYMLSMAMKRDVGKCPYYYKVEEIK